VAERPRTVKAKRDWRRIQGELFGDFSLNKVLIFIRWQVDKLTTAGARVGRLIVAVMRRRKSAMSARITSVRCRLGYVAEENSAGDILTSSTQLGLSFMEGGECYYMMTSPDCEAC